MRYYSCAKAGFKAPDTLEKKDTLIIKNWYVLLKPPADDQFNVIVNSYVPTEKVPSVSSANPLDSLLEEKEAFHDEQLQSTEKIEEKIIQDKTIADIIDVQACKLRDPTRHSRIISYIAGDLFYMGEFKKWMPCIPIYAVTSTKKLCGTVHAFGDKEYIIPIQFGNLDSYKVLFKRSTKWLKEIR